MDLEQAEQEFRDYEIGFIGVSEEVGPAVTEILKRLAVEILLASSVRPLTFAYPIKKNQSGFFGIVHFRTAPEKTEAIHKELFFAPAVLRFLMVTPPLKRAAERSRPMPANQAFRSPVEQPAGTTPERSGSRPAPEILSNELLEQKLEEILQ